LRCAEETTDGQVVGFVGSSTARTEFGEETAGGEEGEAFAAGGFELADVVPFGVDVGEVGFRNDGHERDLNVEMIPNQFSPSIQGRIGGSRENGCDVPHTE
jgi:hypothetical protein